MLSKPIAIATSAPGPFKVPDLTQALVRGSFNALLVMHTVDDAKIRRQRRKADRRHQARHRRPDQDESRSSPGRPGLFVHRPAATVDLQALRLRTDPCKDDQVVSGEDGERYDGDSGCSLAESLGPFHAVRSATSPIILSPIMKVARAIFEPSIFSTALVTVVPIIREQARAMAKPSPLQESTRSGPNDGSR